MKKILVNILAVFLFINMAICQIKSEILNNKTIVDMNKAGLGNDIILSKMESSICRFDMSTNGLLALKTQKVPDEIISAMMNKANGKKAGSAAGQFTEKPTAIKKAKETASAAPDLDIMNVPHYYDKLGNVLKALERSTVAVKAKVNILKSMIPGASTPIVFRMDSCFSPIRIPLAETVSFMVNTGSNVPEIFGLYVMEVQEKKKKREATWFNVSAFENKSDKSVIAFDYKKIRDGVYELIPVKKLEKGEYCFVNKTSYGTYGGAKADVFAFGIY